MGMSRKKRTYIAVLTAFVFVALFALVLFLPYPKAVGAQNDEYTVTWSDGSSARESYFSALSSFTGFSEEGDLCFFREGKFGSAEGSLSLKTAKTALDSGKIAPLMGNNMNFTRLESAALYRVYADTLYSRDGEWYRFDGKNVVSVMSDVAGTVFLAEGELTASALNRTGAGHLILGDGAEPSYRTLWGTSVTVEGRDRYFVENGAIVSRDLGGALRAAEPLQTSVRVPDVGFCDMGALLPCENLVSLSLPFLGNLPTYSETVHQGELGYLFSDGVEYYIPDTLKRVEVRGGHVTSFAFYRCHDLEEIDVSKVDPEEIEPQAFLGLDSLQVLYVPRGDIILTDAEDFTLSYDASRACYVYTRKEMTRL